MSSGGYYADDIAGALEDIAEAGERCVWRHYGEATGGTPAKPADRPYVDHDVDIVFLPIEGTGRAATAQTSEESTEVKAGGVMGLMGQVPFTPDLMDLVTRKSGEVLRIRLHNGIERLAPNGDTILYTIVFER